MKFNIILRHRPIRKPWCVAATSMVILTMACSWPLAKADSFPPEADPKNPGWTPIQHEKYLRGAHDLFSYQPRFTPNVVSFDQNNRPYIRHEGVLQTLDNQGRWIEMDLKKPILAKYPKWDGKLNANPFTELRVAFDRQGYAYVHVDARRSSIGKSLLLESLDQGQTWQVHSLPIGDVQMEVTEGAVFLEGPPTLLVYHDNLLLLVIPQRSADGVLTLSKPILVSDDSLLNPMHSGGGTGVVTRGDLTFIVWPGDSAIEGREGTPEYISVYNRRTQHVAEPKLLGFGGTGKPDTHNWPRICIDSRGYLHVVFGAHHDQFKYTRSLEPLDIDKGWTKPEAFGEPKNAVSKGGYSYVGLVCDANDVLHLVSRWSGNPGYRFHLVHQTKTGDGLWAANQSLVIPSHVGYVNWYHKLRIDRRGRLFLNYVFYANQFSKEEIAAYRKRWPEHQLQDPQGAHHWSEGSQLNDPVLLFRPEASERWRLATTADFFSGIFKHNEK